MSTKRYLPASGTAGLARSLVKGNNRVPAPPPMMIARASSVGIFRFITCYGCRCIRRPAPLRLQDKIGPQKVRMPSRYNLLDDITAFRIRLGSDQRADGKAAQGIAYRKRGFCGVFPTSERQRIRSPLALSI